MKTVTNVQPASQRRETGMASKKTWVWLTFLAAIFCHSTAFGFSEQFELRRGIDAPIANSAVQTNLDDQGDPGGFISLDVSDKSQFLILDSRESTVLEYDAGGKLTTSSLVVMEGTDKAIYFGDKIAIRHGSEPIWTAFDRSGAKFTPNSAKTSSGFNGNVGPPVLTTARHVQVGGVTWTSPANFDVMRATLIRQVGETAFVEIYVGETSKVGGSVKHLALRFADSSVEMIEIPRGQRAVDNALAVSVNGKLFALIDEGDSAKVVQLTDFVRELTFAPTKMQAASTTVTKIALPSITPDQVLQNAEALLMPQVFIPASAILRVTDRPGSNVACRVRPYYLRTEGWHSIPYSWGGYTTASTWQAQMFANRLAGNATGVNSSCLAMPAGADCSGALGAAWGVSGHPFATINVVGTYAASISDAQLGRGDALNWAGKHVVLIVNRSGDSLEIIEAEGVEFQKVVRRWVSLATYRNRGYLPIRRNNMTTDAVPSARFTIRSAFGQISENSNVSWNFGSQTPSVTLDATASTPSTAGIRWLVNNVDTSGSRMVAVTLNPGSNRVELRVNNTANAASIINVIGGTSGAPPSANFVVRTPVGNASANSTSVLTVSAGTTGLSATLDGQTSTPVGLSYTWTLNNTNLGNGSIIGNQLRLGSNVVTLLVRDNQGRTGTATANITVQAPPQSTALVARFTGTTSPNRGAVSGNMSANHWIPAGQTIQYALNASSSTIPVGSTISWRINNSFAGSGLNFSRNLGRGSYTIELRITNGAAESQSRLVLNVSH